jgi:hypothetical protein
LEVVSVCQQDKHKYLSVSFGCQLQRAVAPFVHTTTYRSEIHYYSIGEDKKIDDIVSMINILEWLVD